ncbi:transcription antitermination factor NusB [Geitlerinema sp. PCC 7407]|uniref:transcription antitermination factor NusB n=1 Tax=Geitlerinema sp. PCC 7407 TaxID=1173025 RepID=UPI0002A000FB|nr:transcription antitermination factor NusB [Geitlerinema sp. PCC 7407]AFY67958.1 NusB antitermination factor [Geitlerinema sp. PCC 7407]
MQARRIARELALLSMSQMPTKPEQLDKQQLQNLLVSAVRTLTAEAQDTLETASAELQRGSDRLLTSETRAADLASARRMVQEAIELTQVAINRIGQAIDFPELIQLTNQTEVRTYALQLAQTTASNRTEIDTVLNESMVNWQLSRLPKVDRDILRIAVSEIMYLGTPAQVAIDEAVELAKRYSDDDGRRFINGVLRRVMDYLKTKAAK